MKNTKKRWLIPFLFTLVLVLCCALFIVIFSQKEEPLTNKTVQTQLEKMYGGTVDNLTLEDGIYSAELTRPNGSYSVQVDSIKGTVLALNQLSKIETESTQILSEEEAREFIAKAYTGDIERISLNKNEEPAVYDVEVVKDQALVEVRLDAISGEIRSENTKKTTIDNVIISKDQAITIALEQLRGDVEYVAFEQTEDGGYYIVEIEQDNDNTDDIEAVFQIHAVTGVILSIQYDD